jgi:hypothetical protein
MAQGMISVSMTDAHRPREQCDDNDGAEVIRGLDRLGSSVHDLVVKPSVPNLSW